MRRPRRSRTKKILQSSSTDTEQLCYTCGCVGHPQDQCALNKVTIVLNDVPETSNVEFIENRNLWRRGNYMKYQADKQAFMLKTFLRPGYHEFKFLVDSSEWVLSKIYPTTVTKQGIVNNYNIVEPVGYPSAWIKSINCKRKTAFVVISLPKYSYKNMLKKLNLLMFEDIGVEVVGSWDNWDKTEKMKFVEKTDKFMDIYTIVKELPISDFQYKFKINGNWILDPFRELVSSDMAPNHPLNMYEIIKKTWKDLLKPKIDANQLFNVYEYSVEKLEIFTLYGHSMNLVNSQIWVYGGYHSNSFIGLMIKIDPQNLNVSFVNSVNGPGQLGFHKSLTYGNKIIMFGGQKDEAVEYKYFTFNTENSTWTTCKIKNMPAKREMFGLVHKKGTPLVYIFGGYYCSHDLKIEKNFNDFHVLHLDHMTFENLQSKNPPEPRCHHSINIIDTDLYLFGGMQVVAYGKICFNDFYKININDHSELHWEKLNISGTLPTPRYGHLSFTFGTQLIIHGGTYFNPNKYINYYFWDLYVIDTKKLLSISVKLNGDPKKLGRAFHAGCIYNNSIIIFGGKFSHNPDKNNTKLYYIPLKTLSKSPIYAQTIDEILNY